MKVGFSCWKDRFGGCVAGGEKAGGREAGFGLLQVFMQEMVKPELESRPEDRGEKWAKKLSREENGWDSGTDHVGGGG